MKDEFHGRTAVNREKETADHGTLTSFMELSRLRVNSGVRGDLMTSVFRPWVSRPTLVVKSLTPVLLSFVWEVGTHGIPGRRFLLHFPARPGYAMCDPPWV